MPTLRCRLPSIRLHSAPSSVSHGGGRPEVGEELEAEAHHEVPDVAGHLRAGDEDPPDEDQEQRVEGVVDVPQPGQVI